MHARADDASIDEEPECQRIRPQCTVRWGLVVESAIGISHEDSQFNPRAAVRLNVPLTDVVEVRADFVLGGFPSFTTTAQGLSYSKFGVGVRVDLQFNVGSVYTLGLGGDAVLAFWGGVVGTHASILGFRFGAKRQFLVNAPQQLWINLGSSKRGVIEQLFSFSYLFGS
jgi:hypothetical protein